ncbi:MAG TPA: hypothetical protein VGM37_13065 [Armatimonadota bacterium]|jgi:hypothetical protein
MPYYAYLHTDFHCNSCGALLENHLVTFKWGYCPTRVPATVVYLLGDQVFWRTFSDGTRPAWALFHRGGWNFGDPAVRDLVVVDVRTDVSGFPDDCPACGVTIHGAAIDIEDGIFKRVWLIAPGQFEDDVGIYLRRDGELVPMREWMFHEYTRYDF